LQLNGTYQLIAYADDVNILGGSEHNMKKKAESLVVASKETGLEVMDDKRTWSCLEIRMPEEVTI
jgi:hypothetical protein